MSANQVTLRRYRGRPDDALLAVIAQSATEEPYSAEKVAFDLSVPGINQDRDIIVCELDGRVVGYAQILIDTVKDARQGRLVARIPTGSPHDTQAARGTLLWAARRMQGEIAEGGRPVTLVELVKEEELERREFLDDAGFLTIRHYRILRVDNPADIADIPLPENHSYIHGPGMQGAEEYVAMFNETWIDHYGFIPLTVQNFLHDINDDPEYNPSLDIVISRADGRFVGFAFCRLEPSDAMLGEVMAIGVRRGYRGTGLGRKLLTHSVRTIVELGAKQVELTVDTENPTGAEGLYESVGFKVISMKRRYRLSQDGIIRLATLNVS